MRINPGTWVPALSASSGLWSLDSRPNIPDGSNAVSGPWQVISNGNDITPLVDGTADLDFPPRSWLGFGLDMTTVTPVDILSVCASVLTLARVIELQGGGTQRVLGKDTRWLVPVGVDANYDAVGGKDEDITYASGDKAASAFGADSGLAIRYMAVNGGVSATYAIKKTFQSSFQYSMTAYNAVQILVNFVEYADAINVRLLRRFLDRIPRFNPNDDEVTEAYRDLFAAIGSHVITGVDYGARFQLTAYADNSDASVNQAFGADVNAQFKGLKYGGEWDTKIEATSQYQKYKGTAAKKCSCHGGNQTLRASINSNPSADGVFQTYLEWVESANTDPKVVGFKTQPLWEVLFESKDIELNRREGDVRRAYSWIVEHPKVHLTSVRLSITSDWGEFSLQTPGAFIKRNESAPIVEGSFFSSTKVTWANPAGLGNPVLNLAIE
ncbi:MAG: hypothetical protein Q9178_004548 [Gyalolechia marmorata]